MDRQTTRRGPLLARWIGGLGLLILGTTTLFALLAAPLAFQSWLAGATPGSWASEPRGLYALILVPGLGLAVILVVKLEGLWVARRVRPHPRLLQAIRRRWPVTYHLGLALTILVLGIGPVLLSLFPRHEVSEKGIITHGVFNQVIQRISFDEVSLGILGVRPLYRRGGLSHQFYVALQAGGHTFEFSRFTDDKAILALGRLVTTRLNPWEVRGLEYLVAFREEGAYATWLPGLRADFDAWFSP